MIIMKINKKIIINNIYSPIMKKGTSSLSWGRGAWSGSWTSPCFTPCFRLDSFHIWASDAAPLPRCPPRWIYNLHQRGQGWLLKRTSCSWNMLSPTQVDTCRQCVSHPEPHSNEENSIFGEIHALSPASHLHLLARASPLQGIRRLSPDTPESTQNWAETLEHGIDIFLQHIIK